jgi:hypothetical protein
MSQPTRKARTPPEVPPTKPQRGSSYAAVPRNLRCADGLDYSGSYARRAYRGAYYSDAPYYYGAPAYYGRRWYW